MYSRDSLFAKSILIRFVLPLFCLSLVLAACNQNTPEPTAEVPTDIPEIVATVPMPVVEEAETQEPPTQQPSPISNETSNALVSPLGTPTAFVSPLSLPAEVGQGYVAFHTDQTGTLQIHSIELATGLESQLTLALPVTNPAPLEFTNGITPTQRSFEPDWSPDCEQIVFTSERDRPGAFDLYLMNRDGSDQRPLLPLAEGQERPAGLKNWSPSWSPKGDVIAYQSNQEDDLRVCFATTDGRALGCYNPGWSTALPTWSPDGNQLLFIGVEDGDWDIMIADATVLEDRVELGEALKLTDNTYSDMHPTMSPDGEYIAFEANELDNFDIMVMRSDGSELRRLTFEGVSEVMPSWASNNEVVYAGESIEGWSIRTVDATTGAMKIIKSSDALNKWPVWCTP